MSLEKSELIEKLGVISARYNDVIKVRNKMASFVPEDIYIRQIEVPEFPVVEGGEKNRSVLMTKVEHASENAGSSVKEVYERIFPVPTEPIKKEYNKSKATKGFGCVAIIALAVSIFFLLGGVFGAGSAELLSWTRPIIYTISAIFSIIFAILLAANFVAGAIHKKKENIKEQELLNEYNQALSIYQTKFNEYIEKEQKFFDEYWDWRTIYVEHLAEEERVKAQLEIDRQEAVAEIKEKEGIPAIERLKEVNQDLVSDKYLPKLDKIIALVQEGRATSVQEAIKIINADEVAMQQQILQATLKSFEQAIESFSEETDRIIAENERRNQERREILMEMAEERRREEDQRRWEEEDRREKEERARQDRENQERWDKAQERHNTVIQCNSCARRSGCRVPYTRPNCASYLPK